MTNKQKVIVVTGAARGIGRSISVLLCKQGHKIIMLDIEEKKLEKTKVEYLKKGFYLDYKMVDVGNENEVREAIKLIINKNKKIDILINNAAISPEINGIRRPTHEVSKQEWDEVLNTNLTSVFLLTKYVLPNMIENKYGKIINMSSQAGRTFSKIAGSHYSASKSGIIGFTRTIANEYGRLGIVANCIAPGRINTEMADNLSVKENQKFINEIPVGRAGESSEVASLVSYLCSEKTAFINGSTVDINGGMYMN